MTDPVRRFGDFLIQQGLVTEGQVQEALALQPLTGSRVGESLLSLGYLTRGQLQRALSLAVQKGDAVVLDRPPLGEILVGLRYVSEAQVEAALASQQKTGKRIGEVLVEQGALDHKQLYEALGLQARMSPSPPEPASTTETAVPANGLRLMVIDDSELACALVQEALTAQGYEVTCFNDPFLALEQIDVIKPHLVLTDLDMPGIDGSEVCRRLKTGPTHSLPVIILTANDADTQRVKGLREGADDYVNKGASMEELGARVETVLRRTRETERMRRLFARYTSDAVVEEILRHGDIVLTGEKREVTVLFADLRNFTAFAESRPPEEVMRMLNDVLGRLADAVLEWGGTLDKFLGDGLMAVWGAPVRHEDDVASAVSAALRMHAELRALNALDPEGPQFELGIGLNTGPVLAGSLGNARRTEYTCIGDTVNVASRLCALAGPGEVLVGEGTATALAHVGTLEPLIPVRVKGKTHPVPLFRVTPELDDALSAQRRF
ncbi:MAG: adenylate/guanylate cyclase domain-containing protein [Archangium sp.]|nr:adenylate/guanylate cyclase domain-containing protein [Archangium sp.]